MNRLLFVIGMFFPWAGFAQSGASPIRPFIAFDDPVIALTHCTVVDVINLKTIADQTVVLHDGIITAIGPASGTPPPKGARVMDCAGKSLLPGLVLTHEHLYYPAYSVDPFYVHFKQLPVTFPRLYLACGATTVRTAGSIEPFSDLALKRDIDEGKIAGPSMDLTAPYIENKGGFAPQIHGLSGPEEAKAFVDFWANEGFTSFKAYNMLDKATLKAAIDAVHARGLKLTGHLCSITYREATDLGIDQLEHGFFASTDFVPGKKENECVYAPDALAAVTPDSPAVRQLIDYLVSHKVTLTSTLAIFQAYVPGDTSYRPEVLEAMSPDTREMFLNYYSRMRGQGGDKQMEKEMRMEKLFSDAGGLLTAGTDPTGNGAVLAGYGSQTTIELLVKAGFTPLQAVRIATYNGAKALGMESHIGSIEVGKRADLVVVDGDISKDITNIRHVQWVIKKGIAFDSKKLFESVKGQVGNSNVLQTTQIQTMAQLNPYIHFNGNAEEAFTFYKSVFGGEFTALMRYKEVSSAEHPIPESDANRIMHIVLPIGKNSALKGSDTGSWLGKVSENDNRNAIFITADSREEAERLFKGLSTNGKVEMPLTDGAFGLFGMFTDKYGIEWLMEFSQ